MVDLDKYIDMKACSGLGLLSHPLCVMCPYMGSDFERERALKMIAVKEEMLADCDNAHTWVFLHERPHRLEALLLTRFEVTAELLLAVYVDSEGGHINQEYWLSLFDERKAILRDTLAHLPSTLTLYRGGGHRRGMSWSLSKEVATMFANRSRSAHSRVYEVVVSRDACLAYTNDRSEEEIILDPKIIK